MTMTDQEHQDQAALHKTSQDSIRVSKWLMGVLISATMGGVTWAWTMNSKIDFATGKIADQAADTKEIKNDVRVLTTSATSNDTSARLLSQSLTTLAAQVERIGGRQVVNEERLRLLEIHAADAGRKP